MAQTLSNGVVVPDGDGDEQISATGVQEMRNLGGSVDAQLGNRALVGHTHPIAGVVGLQSALDGKSSTSHKHSWSQITGKPVVFPPGPHRHGWADLDGVPDAFPPSAHGHAIGDVEGLGGKLDGKVEDDDPRLGDDRTPLPHTHTQAQVVGLPAALTAVADTATWEGVSGKPAVFPPSAHTHAVADVTGLGSLLDGKVDTTDPRLSDARAPLAHEHDAGDIAGLEDALAGVGWDQGIIEAGTDLNTVRSPGVYSTYNQAITDSLLNTPPDVTAGVLEVLEATSNAHIQRYSMYSGGHGSKVWTRRTLSVSSGSWTAWEVLATASDVERAGWVKGDVPDHTDLNDLTTPGVYSTRNKTTFESLLNTPPGSAAGALEVIQATSGTAVQRYMGYGGSGADSRIWVRRTASAASGAWSPWRMLATADEVTNGLSGKADTTHSHAVADVTGLEDTLDALAAREAMELTTEHLDTLRAPGVYWQSQSGEAILSLGYPLALAGHVVVRSNPLGTQVSQWFTTYYATGQRLFTRNYYSGWGSWEEVLLSTALEARLANLKGDKGDKGDRGPEGPYGGTTVTDPQVASYVTGETDTRTALDAAYRRGISVTELGATGDGVADDTEALNAAVTRAALFGSPVHVPTGTYRMTGPLTLLSGTSLEMDTGAVLDFSGNTGPTHVIASGSISTGYVPITAGTEKGSYQITVDPAGLAVDDWIRVASRDVYDSANTRVTYGELVQVREVGDGTVTLWTPLRDTYTTGPTIQRVEMIRDVSITGGTIRGNFTPETGKTGVHATFVENMRIHRTRLEGIDTRHIAFDSCVNAWATEIDDYWALTTGTAYGVSFVNMCRDSGVRNSRFRYVRHAFSTNNVLDGPNVGIVRRITFEGNVVDETSRALGGSMAGGTAIDTHGAAEDIDILYNTVNGSTGAGINVECRSGRIIGNRVMDCGNGGIVVHNETDLDGAFIITGNSLIRTGPGFYGIYVYAGTRGGAGKHRGTVITGNSVEGGGHGIGVGRTGGERRDEAVTITGNTIRDVTGRGIYVAGVDTLTEGDNTVINASANGLYVMDVSHGSFGPSSIRMADDFTGWTVFFGAVTYAMVKPGAIRAESAIGIRIMDTCEHMTVGAYSHIHAKTPLSNMGGSTVVVGA